jgi:hypothetical protein
MERRHVWFPVLGAILLSVAAAMVAYNIGVSHALVVNAPAAGAAPGAVPGVVPYYYWHRPWGFGFAPFFFILFWFFALRFLFWGGGFRGRRWHYPGPYDPAGFEEWHRQAHERMNAPPSQPRTPA